MHVYKPYNDYGYKLRYYFFSGLTKIIDLGNFNRIDYPKYMTEEATNDFDTNEIRKDFEVVGNDMRKAFEAYEREHTTR